MRGDRFGEALRLRPQDDENKDLIKSLVIVRDGAEIGIGDRFR